jgi:hypothetical protein
MGGRNRDVCGMRGNAASYSPRVKLEAKSLRSEPRNHGAAAKAKG